jgi:galactose oxidase-like protein/Kelch motif protein
MGERYVITYRRRALRALLAGVLAATGVTAVMPALAGAAPASQDGQWGAVMDFGVPGTHMSLLHNGEVLYWRYSNEARVWDATTGNLQLVPAPYPIPGVNFHCAGHVVLPDGQVLVIGGQTDNSSTNAASVATFDPTTHKWTRLPDMSTQRWYPSVTVLGDGRALVTTGRSDRDDRVTSAEVYDPQTNRWSVLPGVEREADLYAPVYQLPDGRVFNAAPGATTAFLDSGLHGWSPGPQPLWRTNGYSESGAMYEPGKIIRSGGTPPDLAAVDGATDRTAVIDLTGPAPRWEETSRMAFRRRRHNMVILADGSVLAVGGTRQGDDPAQAVFPAEMWSPQTRSWRTVAAMSEPRMYHSAALLLPDGRVLTAGGDAGPEARTAQVYSPPYLFTGSRPAIASAPGELGYGGSFSVSTTNPSDIAGVALIRPSSVTHAYDMDQRYVPLAFAPKSDGLTVAGPASGNVAPPGWYMLVIRDRRGAPSMARWMRIGPRYAPGPAPPAATTPPAPPPVPPPAPPAPPPDPPAPPATGPPSGPAPGSAARAPAAATPEAAGPGVTRLDVRRRIRLPEVRRHGLRITVTMTRWDEDETGRTLRVRLYERRAGRRGRLVTTVSRSLVWPSTVRLALRSPELRRSLAKGLYEVEASVGPSPGRLRVGAMQLFRIVR